MMRRFLTICLLALAGALILRAQSTTRLQFPTVTGEALDGTEVTLPTDLADPFTLVLVAFQKEQQPAVDTWLPAMEAIEDAREDFALFELPTIREVNGIARFFIRRGMRGVIESERGRARTVILFLDKEPFKKALEITDETVIHTFLLDRTGTVRWQTTGTHSPEKEAGLKRVLGP